MPDPADQADKSSGTQPAVTSDSGEPDTSAEHPKRQRFRHRLRRGAYRAASRKQRQIGRISRTSLRYGVFMCGAGFVAAFSMAFAWIAELALHWNARLTGNSPWLAFVLLPLGFAVLRWLTIKFAPQARGSGIPQVIAAVMVPAAGKAQGLLVSFRQSMWKVVLTAGALLAGASVGREGPSVQVGAAAMLAWGRWCHEKLRFRIGFHPNALIAAGAAGGLAAAFNTPLAGVVFAIEELGRGTAVRWDRLVLSGVLTAGFLSLAILGNNPYFSVKVSMLPLNEAWGPVLLCAAVNGVMGGLFAKILIRGVSGFAPSAWRASLARHPIRVAFGCGLVVAILGFATAGATFGTGYEQASGLINGHSHTTQWFGLAKLLATVASYVAGIPGGIFTPALAIGAGIGDNVAYFAGGLAEPRLLALVSMAAFLAAATQAPITASVIVMEMTRTQDLTLFLLAATLLSSFISRQFNPTPFYHHVSRTFRKETMAISKRGSANPRQS